MNLSQNQILIGLAVLFVLYYLKSKKTVAGIKRKEYFVSAPNVSQPTISGSNAVASISVGGLSPMALQQSTTTEALPYYDQGFSQSYAEVTIDEAALQPDAVAVGQPQEVSVLREPIYRLNLPPISGPVTVPQNTMVIYPGGNKVEYQPSPGTENMMKPGPNMVPFDQDTSFNKVLNTDYPGNDISCELYVGGTDMTSCQKYCHKDSGCSGFVDVKPGVNPVFPQGFCCMKNRAETPMQTTGVDAYLKQEMAPY